MFTAHSKNATQQWFAVLYQTEYVRKQNKKILMVTSFKN